MSGIKKVLADTNIFIGVMSTPASLLHFLDDEWHYSFISRIELLSKPELTKAQEKEILLTLDEATLAAYNHAIESQTIAIRRKHRCKLPDAIIAATAIYYNLTLLTFDRGFSVIDGLDVIVLEYA